MVFQTLRDNTGTTMVMRRLRQYATSSPDCTKQTVSTSLLYLSPAYPTLNAFCKETQKIMLVLVLEFLVDRLELHQKVREDVIRAETKTCTIRAIRSFRQYSTAIAAYSNIRLKSFSSWETWAICNQSTNQTRAMTVCRPRVYIDGCILLGNKLLETNIPYSGKVSWEKFSRFLRITCYSRK